MIKILKDKEKLNYIEGIDAHINTSNNIELVNNILLNSNWTKYWEKDKNDYYKKDSNQINNISCIKKNNILHGLLLYLKEDKNSSVILITGEKMNEIAKLIE